MKTNKIADELTNLANTRKIAGCRTLYCAADAINKLESEKAELLAALEGLKQWVGTLPVDIVETIPSKTFNAVQAAISKVKGNQ